MTPRAKKKHAGKGRPLPAVSARWTAEGYLTPDQAAAAWGVPTMSIRKRVYRGLLEDEGEKPAVVKDGKFVWLLRSALEKVLGPAPAPAP